jgi:molybdate transport system substrate-binding protein
MKTDILSSPSLLRATAHLVVALFLTLGIAACKQAEPAKPRFARIAVASNFAEPARALAIEFNKSHTGDIEFTPGSTGKQYAQIINGAPFDAFLSADAARPERLESEKRGVAGSRFTYALGRLALWSATPDFVDAKGEVLRSEKFTHLAIAKPELAPYGAAAKTTLERMALWENIQTRLVFGENISQTFQFVESGNAEIGFVAWSQVTNRTGDARGSFWLVPSEMHEAISQDAILLTQNELAGEFLAYLRTPEAQQIIQDFGYDIPGESSDDQP